MELVIPKAKPKSKHDQQSIMGFMADVTVAAIRKRHITSRGKAYDSYYITLGHDFFHDKKFPFKDEELVIIRIEANGLRIDPLQKKKGAP
jgi:hypothetical protein